MAQQLKVLAVRIKNEKWVPLDGSCQGMPLSKHATGSGINERGLLGQVSEREVGHVGVGT